MLTLIDLNRKQYIRRAHLIVKPDADLGVRVHGVGKFEVDLIEAGKTGRDPGVENRAAVQQRSGDADTELRAALDWIGHGGKLSIGKIAVGDAEAGCVKHHDVPRPGGPILADSASVGPGADGELGVGLEQRGRSGSEVDFDGGTVTAVEADLHVNGSGKQGGGDEEIDLRWRNEVEVCVQLAHKDADAGAAERGGEHLAAEIFRGDSARDVSEVGTIKRDYGVRRDGAGLIARRIDYAGCGVGRRRYSSASFGPNGGPGEEGGQQPEGRSQHLVRLYDPSIAECGTGVTGGLSLDS